MIQTIVNAVLDTLASIRAANLAALTPAQLIQARNSSYERHCARVDAAEARFLEAKEKANLLLAITQQQVVQEVNSRIDVAKSLARTAASILEDLADNGVLDGSNLTPAKARATAAVIRGE
jgi:hypothetical protein